MQGQLKWCTISFRQPRWPSLHGRSEWAGPSGRAQERFEVISGTIFLWAALASCLMFLFFPCSDISFGKDACRTHTHSHGGQPTVYCVLSGAPVVLTLCELLPAPTEIINVRVLRCLSTCCRLFIHAAQKEQEVSKTKHRAPQHSNITNCSLSWTTWRTN